MHTYVVTLTLKNGVAKTFTLRTATADAALLKAKRSTALKSTRTNPIVAVTIQQQDEGARRCSTAM